MTNTNIGEKRHWNALSPEEIERRKTVLREYVLAHPNLTKEEIGRNKEIHGIFSSLYKNKIERGLYDVITRSAPNDTPVEDFRSLVSYMVSKMWYTLKRSGLPTPFLEDMTQDGMLGVLKAQQKCNPRYSPDQNLAFFRKSIQIHIWKGLENYFTPVGVKWELVYGMVILCRYDLSAAEARTKPKIRFFKNTHYSSKTFDTVVNLSNKKREKSLKNIPDLSEEKGEEDMSAVQKDLDVLMCNLSERKKRILFSRLEGQTLEEIGVRLDLTDEGIRQIEINSLDNLVRRMTSLLALEDPHAIRLYREYFEK